MRLIKKLFHAIDMMSEYIGRITMLLVLLTVLISTGNALSRKLFSISSNAMLEIQWYLFSTVFLLGAGYTFLKNAHVRIDFLSSRFSPRTRNIIDIVGIVAVVFPLCVLMIKLSMPLLTQAYATGEVSPDAGGLIRWPVYVMLPLGMALLLMQSASELFKRIAFLFGIGPDTTIEISDSDLPSDVIEMESIQHSNVPNTENKRGE